MKPQLNIVVGVPTRCQGSALHHTQIHRSKSSCQQTRTSPMASNQSASDGEKMSRSKRRNWFIEYCCCCCKCCCTDDDANRPLLQAVTRKDSTPPAPLENEDADELAGEETQQVQLVVAEVESEGQKTPDNMESDAEQENVPEEQEKELAVDLEPTERARVESGTFVRGSGQRASWRLVPTVTQQIKEAIAAEAKTEAGDGEDKQTRQTNSPEGEEATNQLSFQSEDGEERVVNSAPKTLPNVTLIAQDVDEDDSVQEESVTMTFVIGSRGNQEAASNGDVNPSVLNIVSSDGQKIAKGVELSSTGQTTGDIDHCNEADGDINQTASTINTHET